VNGENWRQNSGQQTQKVAWTNQPIELPSSLIGYMYGEVCVCDDELQEVQAVVLDVAEAENEAIMQVASESKVVRRMDSVLTLQLRCEVGRFPAEKPAM